MSKPSTFVSAANRSPRDRPPEIRWGTWVEGSDAYRILLGLTVALIFLFWGAYRVSEPGAIDPLWGRVLFAAIPTSLLALSYARDWWRRHLPVLWRGFLYLIVVWFTGLSLINHFAPSYGLGTMFVVAAVHAGFGVGLRRQQLMWPFVAFTVALPGGAVFLLPAPGTNPVILTCGLLSLAVIFTLIVRWKIRTWRDLERSREQVEMASRLKSTIIGNVSHEFRTPLASILGFSEVLETELDEENRELARSIQRSGRRLQTTLNSLLDLARLEAGEADLDGEAIAVGERVAEVVDDFVPRAEEKGLMLNLDGPIEPVTAHINRTVLERIVACLIDNAVKFTDRGAVTVRVRARDAWIEISVSDTGIGIGEAELERIFESFRQASEGLRREHEGLGLGLTLVAQLTDYLGGSVEVDSEKGSGSRFVVHLPRKHEAARSTRRPRGALGSAAVAF